MATLDQANTDAKFYNEKLVRVTYYDGSVQYYSSKSGLRSMFIPNDYSGSIETLADYSGTNARIIGKRYINK